MAGTSHASVRRARGAGPRPRDPARWAREHGGSLLFVDDNDSLLRLTSRTFQHLGAACRTASTHAGAIDALAADPSVRIVVLDFEMPDGDVAELVQQIHAIRPEVVLVGSSGADHRRDFAERGVDRYLPKPWGLRELIHVAAPEAHAHS